jgi:hypothetical protein
VMMRQQQQQQQQGQQGAPDRDPLVHWCHGSPGAVFLFCKAAEALPQVRGHGRAALHPCQHTQYGCHTCLIHVFHYVICHHHTERGVDSAEQLQAEGLRVLK